MFPSSHSRHPRHSLADIGRDYLHVDVLQMAQREEYLWSILLDYWMGPQPEGRQLQRRRFEMDHVCRWESEETQRGTSGLLSYRDTLYSAFCVHTHTRSHTHLRTQNARMHSLSNSISISISLSFFSFFLSQSPICTACFVVVNCSTRRLMDGTLPV